MPRFKESATWLVEARRAAFQLPPKVYHSKRKAQKVHPFELLDEDTRRLAGCRRMKDDGSR